MNYVSKIFCSNTRATNRNDIELQNTSNDATTEPLNEGEFQHKKVTLCTQIKNKISQCANYVCNNKLKTLIAFSVVAIAIPAVIVVSNAAYNSFSGNTPIECDRGVTDSIIDKLVNNTDSMSEPSDSMSEPYAQSFNSTVISGEQVRTYQSCTPLKNTPKVLSCVRDQMTMAEWKEKTKNIDTASKYNMIYQYCSDGICKLIGITTDAWNKLLKVTQNN